MDIKTACALKVLNSYQQLEDLRIKYETQGNRITSSPIFVTVQELHRVGVMNEDYGVECPYGEGLNKIEFWHSDLDESYDSIEEIKIALLDSFDLRKDCEEDSLIIEGIFDNIKELKVGYIWIDVQWFLTIEGAEQYIALNRHNLKHPRTYVHHFSDRNVEMRKLLETIGFKTKD